MISLKNILIIAKFETKILWRNWFFRILAILGIGFLTIFNLAAFSPVGNARWVFIANGWGIPYGNMILLSIGQAAAIIFLSTGTILKNKKIDTNEVFLVRPLSNADYVFGKALAIFKLFFGLNLVILCIALIFNITNPKAVFNPQAYIYYPLLTSFSSIIFTTGIAFFVTTLLRNQPLSIIILLGISAVVVIYLRGKYDNAFDFMSFRLSLLASEISGFSHLKLIIWQRAFYFLAGITFLFSTALFLHRLANRQSSKFALAGSSLLFASLAAVMMFNFLKVRTDNLSLRKEMIDANGKWAQKQTVQILSNEINLKHLGDQIAATSIMTATNPHNEALDSLYLTLNPGLTVGQVKVNEEEVDFGREKHILSIPLKNAIASREELKLSVAYQGKILEKVTHLEVDEERQGEWDFNFVYAIEKRYAFLQPDYVLLTQDVLWYPDTQIGYSDQASIKSRSTYTNFRLNVEVTGKNVPVSQGKMEQLENNTYQFRPEYPLPQISLAIGQYEKKEIIVDSINYSIFHHQGSDYFTDYFDEVQDTLSFLIKDLLSGYQHDQKIKYPFSRLRFVEVPIQFSAYDKVYQDHQTFIQPETVYWPEKGGYHSEFDFTRQFRNMDRQAREQNQVMADKEKQANVFNNLVKRFLTKQINTDWVFDGRQADERDYSLFANLYEYNTGIVSKDWSTLNRSISNYLNQEKSPENDFSRNISGISFTEECNKLMRASTIDEILTKEKGFSKVEKSITLKGEYLFAYIGQLIGEEKFRAFLYDWIDQHAHQLVGYEEFRKTIVQSFDLDIDPIIQQIYFEKDQPSFLIEDFEKYELLDGDRKRYQVLFNVRNTGKTDGIIKVSFNYKNAINEFGFIRRTAEEVPEEESPDYLTVVKLGETKQIGFLLDSRPQQIVINTLVSQNIPSVITLSGGKFDLRENVTPIEGEKIVANKVKRTQYEVIVDNEDVGFSTFSPIKDTYLKEFLDSRNPSDKKYYGSWRRSYAKWLATTGSDFYGQHVRSAHFTRSGKGEKITQWTPELNEGGFYDLYAFMMGKNQNQFVGNNNQNRKYTYQYLVNHADGTDEINFDLSNAKRGWNYLGSYYFPEKGGSVVLTDQCDLRTVYADAIKWVKQ